MNRRILCMTALTTLLWHGLSAAASPEPAVPKCFLDMSHFINMPGRPTAINPSSALVIVDTPIEVGIQVRDCSMNPVAGTFVQATMQPINGGFVLGETSGVATNAQGIATFRYTPALDAMFPTTFNALLPSVRLVFRLQSNTAYFRTTDLIGTQVCATARSPSHPMCGAP